MISDTSRAAYHRTDRSAGQRKVLDFLASHEGAFTRDEIAKGAGMLLQTVCGRCSELLADGSLVELPAVAGKHPLKINDGAPAATVPSLSVAPPAGVAVTPHIPGRWSMPREMAERNKQMPAWAWKLLSRHVREEVDRVLAGEKWWIWEEKFD
jgi:hypothetical protein